MQNQIFVFISSCRLQYLAMCHFISAFYFALNLSSNHYGLVWPVWHLYNSLDCLKTSLTMNYTFLFYFFLQKRWITTHKYLLYPANTTYYAEITYLPIWPWILHIDQIMSCVLRLSSQIHHLGKQCQSKHHFQHKLLLRHTMLVFTKNIYGTT